MEYNKEIEKFTKVIEDYTTLSKLTPRILNELIDKIIIHQPVKEEVEK
ncbi:DUF4368 domain-containing protein [Streptococcus pneumoniae]